MQVLTEQIAISESQERMAVVVDPRDVEQFLAYAKEENLEAVEVAVVTETPRLVLSWRGKEIVNIPAHSLTQTVHIRRQQWQLTFRTEKTVFL